MHRAISGLPRANLSVTRAAKREPCHAHACICSCAWERGATFRRTLLWCCRVIVVSLPCYCRVGWRATFDDSRTCVKTISESKASFRSRKEIKKALISHGGLDSFRVAENSRTDEDKPVCFPSSRKDESAPITVSGFHHQCRII